MQEPVSVFLLYSQGALSAIIERTRTDRTGNYMASLRFRLRQQYWKWVAPRKIQAYIDSHDTRKLQIGAGSNGLKGWLNTTLYPFDEGMVFMDGTVTFPFPDNSLDYVFSEHVIEHVKFEHGMFMLKESFRTLKSGGRIRIATPDLAKIIAIYTNPNGNAQQLYIKWIMDTFRPHIGEYNPAHVINQSFHGWEHVFIYDKPTLKKAFEDAGFVDVKQYKPNHSDDEHLNKIEQHGQYVGSNDAMLYETMIFEGRKP